MQENDTEPEAPEESQGEKEARPERKRRRLWLRAALITALLPVAYYLLCILGFVYLRFLPPLATGVQVQRVIERTLDGETPVRDYRWLPVEQMSVHVPRAVVAAEDARFYLHDGFDWEEIQNARVEAVQEGEPMRGASTLTQQLIKNLYFSTHRNVLRKAYEWALTPFAEWILGKDRILELYVNVVEFGPGTFGAEAGSRLHFGMSAARLSRHQAAGLATVLPAPLRRRPQVMGWYTTIIEERMTLMGW
jgi:monofunctional biosynthetic peptidoglycan transglycosylase